MINQSYGIMPWVNDSLLVAPYEYEVFHLHWISQLDMHLNHVLQGTGYRASPMPGLQITTDAAKYREKYPDHPMPPSRPEPDGAIWHQKGSSPPATTLHQLAPQPLVQGIPISKAFNIAPENHLTALGIFKADQRGSVMPGHDLISWWEIPSPTNKTGQERLEYEHKRASILPAVRSFVEVDPVFNMPPMFNWPAYKRNKQGNLADPRAKPFYITVTDTSTGLVHPHLFGVEEPFPIVSIPLIDQDLNYDFAPSYNNVIKGKYFDRQMPEQFKQFPALWAYYTNDDQDRIGARAREVLRGERDGRVNDKQQSPLPLPANIKDARLGFQRFVTRTQQLGRGRDSDILRGEDQNGSLDRNHDDDFFDIE